MVISISSALRRFKQTSESSNLDQASIQAPSLVKARQAISQVKSLELPSPS